MPWCQSKLIWSFITISNRDSMCLHTQSLQCTVASVEGRFQKQHCFHQNKNGTWESWEHRSLILGNELLFTTPYRRGRSVQNGTWQVRSKIKTKSQHSFNALIKLPYRLKSTFAMMYKRTGSYSSWQWFVSMVVNVMQFWRINLC